MKLSNNKVYKRKGINNSRKKYKSIKGKKHHNKSKRNRPKNNDIKRKTVKNLKIYVGGAVPDCSSLNLKPDANTHDVFIESTTKKRADFIKKYFLFNENRKCIPGAKIKLISLLQYFWTKSNKKIPSDHIKYANEVTSLLNIWNNSVILNAGDDKTVKNKLMTDNIITINTITGNKSTAAKARDPLDALDIPLPPLTSEKKEEMDKTLEAAAEAQAEVEATRLKKLKESDNTIRTEIKGKCEKLIELNPSIDDNIPTLAKGIQKDLATKLKSDSLNITPLDGVNYYDYTIIGNGDCLYEAIVAGLLINKYGKYDKITGWFPEKKEGRLPCIWEI